MTDFFYDIIDHFWSGTQLRTGIICQAYFFHQLSTFSHTTTTTIPTPILVVDTQGSVQQRLTQSEQPHIPPTHSDQFC